MPYSDAVYGPRHDAFNHPAPHTAAGDGTEAGVSPGGAAGGGTAAGRGARNGGSSSSSSSSSGSGSSSGGGGIKGGRLLAGSRSTTPPPGELPERNITLFFSGGIRCVVHVLQRWRWRLVGALN